MYIIAGLGNPTSKYARTRHNVGFDCIDILSKRFGIKVNNAKHKALCGIGMIGGEKVLLMQPQTFMNLSGEAVAEAVKFYKINPAEELIIIYDDISLAPGRLRLRKKGSAGGHNGIKSIIAQLGTQDFKRIKIGVGEKPDGWDLANHVLGYFKNEERKLVDEALLKAAEATECIISDTFENAMNRFNG